MNPLLAKLLERRKLKLEELGEEEQKDFKRWEEVLSKNVDITVDNLREFCQSQLDEIQEQMKNLDNDTRKNERLVLLFSVYKALSDAMTAPQKERKSLEAYLTGLLSE